MFDTIHHIAIIGSDYEQSKHFYVDLLGFKNYRKEQGSLQCLAPMWSILPPPGIRIPTIYSILHSNIQNDFLA